MIEQKISSIEFGIHSENGIVKENNEDSGSVISGKFQFGDSKELVSIASVADGVGGRPFGEIASRVVVSEFNSSALNYILNHERLDNLETEITYILKTINSKLMEIAIGKKLGMATTFVGFVSVMNYLVYASLGDSTLILKRTKTEQITKYQRDEFTGRLTSCLGVKGLFSLDTGTLYLRKGDILTLMSDGITDSIPMNQINNVLNEKLSSQTHAEKLVNIAMKDGGRDNATAVVLKYS